MLDLLLPAACGGCSAEGVTWCEACAGALAVAPDRPWLVAPRVDPGVPVFSLGRYAGVRRRVLIGAKEHGRRDLLGPLALALGQGLRRLAAWQLVGVPLTVVPAPTRTLAARRRGGDPVARVAAGATRDIAGVEVVTALRMRAATRDSVGLDHAARARNVAGNVRLRRRVAGPVLLVDDIVTTGVTAAESVRVLRGSGADVVGVLVLAHA